MGVNLGGVNSGVSEQVLYDSEIRSALEQVSGECVTQSVGGYCLIDAGFYGMLHDDAVHRA